MSVMSDKTDLIMILTDRQVTGDTCPVPTNLPAAMGA